MGFWRRHLSRGLSWPTAELGAGEQVLLEQRANWSRRGVARGGTLVITGGRVLFQPNSMEGSIGLLPATWDRSHIEKVDVAPRGWNLLAGALRRRLRFTFVDGAQALFVVDDPDAVSLALAAET